MITFGCSGGGSGGGDGVDDDEDGNGKVEVKVEAEEILEGEREQQQIIGMIDTCS